MPFKRRTHPFAWEAQAACGQEFVATVSVREASKAITLLLRVANTQSVVFVIRRHKTVMAILASPRLMFNLLAQRQAGHHLVHPIIGAAIEKLITHTPVVDAPPTTIALSTIIFSVARFQPNLHRSSFLDHLNRNNVCIGIRRYNKPYGLLVPFSTLVEFWRQPDRDSALTDWARGALGLSL